MPRESYRILEGDKPFEDYWLVSGLSIDYVQAFFFKIFGINFQSYVLQASLFNGLLRESFSNYSIGTVKYQK